MRAVLAFAVFCILVGVAGCSGSESSIPNPNELGAVEYAFVVLPVLSDGVATFFFENSGREVHEFLLLRLPDGRSLADLKAGLQQRDSRIPAWVDQVGGVPLLSAGEEVRLTRELDDGRYALVCTSHRRGACRTGSSG